MAEASGIERELAVIGKQLERIANALERATDAPTDAADDGDQAGCTHPPDDRLAIDTGTFFCNACQQQVTMVTT